jgi:tetratricopeptide (TPR) repeat protein
MAKWTAFPYPDPAYAYTDATLRKHWSRLHRGDCEPLPKDRQVLEAWIAYHRGSFERAAELGLEAGLPGYNAANKATSIYAFYLEKSDRKKLDLYQEVIARCEALQAADPGNANAFYLCANALGRYSQGISVAKALSQGLGGRIKDNLLTALKLQPKHAEAHIALGAFHAEVIDKVGALIGGVTYGAKRDTAVKAFRTALELIPHSAIARTVYADALVMLDGKKALKHAERLYAEAAACDAADAMERLDVEAARAEID